MSAPKRWADLPDNPEDLAGLMRQRWADTEEELSQLMGRERELHRCVLERRTKAGRALTQRGLKRMLDDLRAVHMRTVFLMMEGCGLEEAVRRHEHNERWLRIREVAA